MTNRIEIAGLRVAGELFTFVADEALPGTGIGELDFWKGFAAILKDLAPRNRALLARRDDLQAKLDELETLVGSGEKALAARRSEIDTLMRRDIQRSARIARNSMEAVITAVNQDWGFLVIGAGANSGFTPQTSLLVQRDGQLVGRVTPSAIEPTQTIAEIDFDSLPAGARIQPGDRVILAKPNAN